MSDLGGGAGGGAVGGAVGCGGGAFTQQMHVSDQRGLSICRLQGPVFVPAELNQSEPDKQPDIEL